MDMTGLQDADLDVGVVGIGYGDEVPADDSPQPSKTARSRRNSQRGLCHGISQYC